MQVRADLVGQRLRGRGGSSCACRMYATSERAQLAMYRRAKSCALIRRSYTTVNDGRVDSISIDLGPRGSLGRFRVDDLKVEAAG